VNYKPGYSAEGFDPYSFAEWWLEHKWAEKRPEELRRYLEGLKRREEKRERS
jgi:hypothetical protein